MSRLIKDLRNYEKYAEYLRLKSDNTQREYEFYCGYLAALRLAINVIKAHKQ